jgi:CTP:molybdopterin cytidylyltransferase MocA
MRPIAVILAAGRGERLGGPKALLAWPSTGAARKAQPERPLAIAHAEARLDAECGRALVIARQPVVKVLLRYVRPGIDLLASAADAPPARADTVARLLERLRAGQPALLAVRPRYNGRRGHPVVLRAEVLARYLEPSPPPLRDHLRALGERCADEDVDDPAVLVDLDRPLDVLRWTGGPPRFLG